MKINMMMIVALLVLTAPLAAEMPSPESAGEVVFTVHVTNATKGGAVGEGSPVTVTFYQDGQPIEQMAGETDAAGNCVLSGIPAGQALVAVAQAKHSDMLFSGSPLQLVEGQSHFEIGVKVFDVVYESGLIRAGTHHLIIKRQKNSARVTEYIQLINDLDRAVLSDQQDAEEKYKVVQMSLPKGFENLTFSSYFHAQEVVVTPSGFYDTMAIPPGQYHGVFSYDLPTQDEIINFDKTMTLPVESVMIFIQIDGIVVTGLGEPAGQMTLTDGVLVDYYTVDAGSKIGINFRMEIKATASSDTRTWWVLGVVFGVIVLVALLRLFRS